jgi:hypothetical protein
MNQVTCPHCGALSAAGAYCQSCGKALPSAMPGGPRIVSGADLASTPAGQKLQADELHKQAKKARGALLAVAIIRTVVIGILYAMANNAGAGLNEILAILATHIIIAVIFWGLYVWSRYQPLPAAIIGLIAYSTLVVINVVTTIGLPAEARREGFGGIGIGWLDIVIIVILANAITAGTKHRKLVAQMGGAR